MLFIMLSNVCRLNESCSFCILKDNDYHRCFLSLRHISEYIDLKSKYKLYILDILSKSCSEGIPCNECELKLPNSMYCNFKKFCSHIILLE